LLFNDTLERAFLKGVNRTYTRYLKSSTEAFSSNWALLDNEALSAVCIISNDTLKPTLFYDNNRDN
jgi:hypothetical protein